MNLEGTHTTHSQEWLANRLTMMQQKNPAISMRSMASILKISPACLSLVMNGRRPMSKRLALRLSDYFCLSSEETKDLIYSSMKKAEPTEFKKRTSRIKKDEIKVLDEDQFRIVSDWYHYAILSLSGIKSNQADPKWIAGRLGITEFVAAEAFERLERLKLIERKGKGFRQLSKPLTTSHDTPNSALRHFHKQNLALAEKAIDEVPVKKRDFGGLTLAFDKKKLPKAKKMLLNFRRRFWKEMENESLNPNSVYTLGIQFFPVSKERS